MYDVYVCNICKYTILPGCQIDHAGKQDFDDYANGTLLLVVDNATNHLYLTNGEFGA